MTAADTAAPNSSMQTSKASAVAPSVPPLRPRRKLFAALFVTFGLWVSAMLAMYFVTIFPHHHRLTIHVQPYESRPH
jgi:hypothetical protein